MADIRLSEFKGFGRAKGDEVPALDTVDMVHQVVEIAATANSATATTQPIIEIYAGADCHLSFDGTDATTSDYFLASGATTPPLFIPIGTAISVKDTS